VLHQPLRFVFGVEDRELGEHSHVSSLKTKTSFEERNELVGVSTVLVKLDERLKFFGVDDEVETTDLSETELLLVDTSSVDLLPDSIERKRIESAYYE
jgi:hypothetical protein